MLVIRLARQGRTKYPVYRVVAADKRRAATSKFVAILGHYNPHTKEIVLKKEKIEAHLNNGAQASDRVLRLLKAEGVKLPAWAKTHDRNKPPKKTEEEAKSDKPQTEPAAEGVETAQAQAEPAETKAEAQKTDVGTEKEADAKQAEAKTQEKVADAAIAEAKKEAEEKQPE